MNKLLAILIFLVCFCVTSEAQTRQFLQGACEKGNEVVTTDGRPSTTKVQRSYPSCTVTVFDAGTVNLATIFSTEGGGALSNPFVADANGRWGFWVATGRYDVRLSGAGLVTPITLPNLWVTVPGSGGGGTITGSGAAGQLTIWTGTTSIGGDPAATYNTSSDTLLLGGSTPTLQLTTNAFSSLARDVSIGDDYMTIRGAGSLAADTPRLEFINSGSGTNNFPVTGTPIGVINLYNTGVGGPFQVGQIAFTATENQSATARGTGMGIFLDSNDADNSSSLALAINRDGAVGVNPGGSVTDTYGANVLFRVGQVTTQDAQAASIFSIGASQSNGVSVAIQTKATQTSPSLRIEDSSANPMVEILPNGTQSEQRFYEAPVNGNQTYSTMAPASLSVSTIMRWPTNFPTTGQVLGVSSVSGSFVNTDWITVSGGSGLGDPGSNGIVVRTALNTTTAVSIAAGTGISVTNGSGVAGNPTVAFNIASAAHTHDSASTGGLLNASNVFNAGVVSLARGGTGASLSDPGADRILFWDDSGNTVDWLTIGSGLSIVGTTISVSAGGGNVTGPGSSTDNAIVRFDGITGQLIQNSTVIVGDTGNVTGLGTLNTHTIPGGTDTFALVGASQSFTNKTIAGSNNIGLVTMSLGSDAGSDMYYRNGSGVLTRLPIGTNGQMLAVVAGVPTWANGATVSGGISAGQVVYGVGANQVASEAAFAYSALTNTISIDGSINLGTASSTTGTLVFMSSSSANTTTFQSGTTPAGSYIYILPADTPATGEFLRVASFGVVTATLEWATPAGGGNVTGPGSSTDNAIVRFDGTSGTTIQNSVITIADSTGVITVPSNSWSLQSGTSVFSVDTDQASFDLSGTTNTTPGSISFGVTTAPGQSSGVSEGFRLFNVYNQSATAGGIDLRIIRQEGSLGSGVQRLIQAETLSAIKFVVTNTGEVMAGFPSASTGKFTMAVSGDADTQSLQGADTPASTLIFKWPSADPTSGQVLSASAPSAGVVTLSWVTGGGGGGISGPGSSTDNAIVRWDGTGGTAVQNSGITIDDSNNQVMPSAAYLGWSTDTAVFRDAARTLGIRGPSTHTGTSELFIYGSFASGTQYRRARIATDASGMFIGHQHQNEGNVPIQFQFNATTVSQLNTDSTWVFGQGAAGGAQMDVRSQSASRVGFKVDSAANSTVDLAQFNLTADDTSTTANIATFTTNSNGTAANGFGSQFTFALESASNNGRTAAGLEWRWTDATDATRTSQVSIWTVASGGSLTERLSVTASSVSTSIGIGNGFSNASPISTATIQGTGGSGSNVAGTNIVFFGGTSTGTGTPGQITLSYTTTSTTGGSGVNAQDTGQYLIPSTLFTQSANASVSSTASETTLIGTGVNDDTVGGNVMRVGRTVWVHIEAVVTPASTPDLTLRFKLGTTTLLTRAWTAMAAATYAVSCDVYITGRTLGASGSAIANGSCTATNTTTGAVTGASGVANTAGTTVDFTSDKIVDVTAQWSNTSSSLTSTHALVNMNN